jgi:uncharacterized protein
MRKTPDPENNGSRGREQADSQLTNRDLLIPYLAPYFAYVLIAYFFENRIPMEWNYTLRLIIVPLLLAWAWKWYIPLKGPKNPLASIGLGVVAGIVGCIAWIALMIPFVDPFEGAEWSQTGFYLRLLSASLMVPVFEELFMRGYVLRVALQWDRARKSNAKRPFDTAFDHECIDTVAPGEWSTWAVIISTIAFTLGHHHAEWPAAVVYGILMAGLWILRKDLLSCIVAHGVTNFTLALYVKSTGQWGLW